MKPDGKRRAWGFSLLTTGGLFLHGEEGPHQDEPPPHLGSLGGSPTLKEWPRGLSRIWGSSRRLGSTKELKRDHVSRTLGFARNYWNYKFFFVLILSGLIGTRSMLGPVGNIMESISGFYFLRKATSFGQGLRNCLLVWWSVTWDGWHQWFMFVDGLIIPLSKWLGSSQVISHNKKVHLEDVPQPDP